MDAVTDEQMDALREVLPRSLRGLAAAVLVPALAADAVRAERERGGWIDPHDRSPHPALLTLEEISDELPLDEIGGRCGLGTPLSKRHSGRLIGKLERRGWQRHGTYVDGLPTYEWAPPARSDAPAVSAG